MAVMVWAAAAQAQDFLEGLEDVPLMPGLTTVEDAGMVFDTPGGRIVESYATGALDRGEVVGFYAETLPALGQVVAQDRESYVYLVESIRRFPNQDRLASMIRDAGLEKIAYRNLSGGIAAIHSAWRI